MTAIDSLELRRLSPAETATGLRAAAGGGRGWLDLDPVTQNDELLALELDRTGTEVYRCGTALLGYRVNPHQPRQATVATTSADPEPLRAFLEFLPRYQRCDSYLALVPVDDPAAAAYAGCGFTPAGRLREHRFAAGAYHDVLVLFATSEPSCPS